MEVQLVQWGVNGLLTLTTFLGGLWVRSLMREFDALKKENAELRKELCELREKMSETCVRRDDYMVMRKEVLEALARIDGKVDRINEKLGVKA